MVSEKEQLNAGGKEDARDNDPLVAVWPSHRKPKRLKRAFAQLTRFPNRSVAEIAAQAGFSNISHFNRLFRQRFGQPEWGTGPIVKVGVSEGLDGKPFRLRDGNSPRSSEHILARRQPIGVTRPSRRTAAAEAYERVASVRERPPDLARTSLAQTANGREHKIVEDCSWAHKIKWRRECQPIPIERSSIFDLPMPKPTT
jgi:hypothetical protein